MDKARIQAAVKELLLAVGEEPGREGLLETPQRVANMYEEIFSGLEDDPHNYLKIFLLQCRRSPFYLINRFCCRSFHCEIFIQFPCLIPASGRII